MRRRPHECLGRKRMPPRARRLDGPPHHRCPSCGDNDRGPKHDPMPEIEDRNHVTRKPRLQKHSSRSRPLNDLQSPFSHGLPGVTWSVFTPIRPSQCCTALAMNSGPLSDPMCPGGPRVTNRSANAARTASLRKRRATGSARHSRLASPMIDRIRNLPPSCVRRSTKSQDQTWPGYAGLSRLHGPSFSQSRLRLGCLVAPSGLLCARCAPPACGSPADPHRAASP